MPFFSWHCFVYLKIENLMSIVYYYWIPTVNNIFFYYHQLSSQCSNILTCFINLIVGSVKHKNKIFPSQIFSASEISFQSVDFPQSLSLSSVSRFLSACLSPDCYVCLCGMRPLHSYQGNGRYITSVGFPASGTLFL